MRPGGGGDGRLGTNSGDPSVLRDLPGVAKGAEIESAGGVWSLRKLVDVRYGQPGDPGGPVRPVSIPPFVVGRPVGEKAWMKKSIKCGDGPIKVWLPSQRTRGHCERTVVTPASLAYLKALGGFGCVADATGSSLEDAIKECKAEASKDAEAKARKLIHEFFQAGYICYGTCEMAPGMFAKGFEIPPDVEACHPTNFDFPMVDLRCDVVVRQTPQKIRAICFVMWGRYPVPYPVSIDVVLVQVDAKCTFGGENVKLSCFCQESYNRYA